VSGISESVHLFYLDTAFRNFIAYKGNANYFCILVLAIVTLMITVYCSKVNFNTIKAKVKSDAPVVGGRDVRFMY
jgi:hypothetical protein